MLSSLKFLYEIHKFQIEQTLNVVVVVVVVVSIVVLFVVVVAMTGIMS